MDRRYTLKTIITLTAGATLLHSCVQDKDHSSVFFGNLKITGPDETLLADLCGTLIPKTDTPGAREVGAHLFALMMIHDCFPPQAQDKFLKGLEAFKEFSLKKSGKSFLDSPATVKAELLSALEAGQGIPDTLAYFYQTLKRLTIEAFTTSQYYLTNVQVYVLVPGRFFGCVPVSHQA